MKSLPIGIENFKEIIDKNYYYVDKSELIEDIIPEKVVLITRPRRFGKTLNMSMLYYFFSNKEVGNSYLFNSLNITNNKEAMKLQNQYPVIRISLKDLQRPSFEMQIDKYASIIANIATDFDELTNSDKLSAYELDMLASYRNRTATINDLSDALSNLSLYLYKHYNRKTIILIDEYDVPLQTAYLKGYYNEMTEFIKGVFISALKTNDALEKGIMTGCLRIAKESIFTGLNNFKVLSIFDELTSTRFGFTQEEIISAVTYYGINDKINELKEWYDGYLFGSTEIYNPWSTLRYIEDISLHNKSYPEAYWANTSSNDIVINYIENANEILRNELEQLMQGKSIIKKIYPELTYRELDDIENIYSYLLFTGYLKPIKRIDYETYELAIPNKEIYIIYDQSFKKYFIDYQQSKRGELLLALKKGNVNEANDILYDILQKSISYYDNYETFYHGLLLGLFEGNSIRSNVESGDGRFDIAILSTKPFDVSILIECKKSETFKDLVKDAQNACDQIIRQRYIEGLQNEGYMNVNAYGISFYKKSCRINKVEK